MTYQAVQAPPEQVHSPHLHGGGGDGGAADRRPQVQVEQVPQEVSLRRDHRRLLPCLHPRGGRVRALGALAPAGNGKGKELRRSRWVPWRHQSTRVGFAGSAWRQRCCQGSILHRGLRSLLQPCKGALKPAPAAGPALGMGHLSSKDTDPWAASPAREQPDKEGILPLGRPPLQP